MKPELLQILQHSLGLNQYGQGNQYRNHFVAGGRDAELCRELVTDGYMTEHAPRMISGGDPIFSVTAKGVDHVTFHSPLPPPQKKLTPSKKRYRRYLDIEECFGSFKDFLKWENLERQRMES